MVTLRQRQRQFELLLTYVGMICMMRLVDYDYRARQGCVLSDADAGRPSCRESSRWVLREWQRYSRVRSLDLSQPISSLVIVLYLYIYYS